MAEFTPAAVKPTVGVEALDALDIHVGTIERVEDVPRSDKLMKLTVNFGDHSRTILAGIKKERENPREIEGRQALFVVNLEPRKMANVGHVATHQREVMPLVQAANHANASRRLCIIQPTSERIR